jgi:hypothetical protein
MFNYKIIKMYIQILLCSALITGQVLYSQMPTGTSGKTLYQKGECKVLVPNVSYKCTFCEDKDLKVNCKSYDCSLTSCTESKSIKDVNGSMQNTLVNIEGKQVKFQNHKDTVQKPLPFLTSRIGANDTTSKLPKGTKFENGKVVVTNGYRAVRSSDKTMVLIVADNGLGAHGSFRCDCGGRGTGACNTSIINNKIICGGDKCCELVVTIEEGEGLYLTMEEIENNSKKLTWKRIVFPKQIK